MISSNEKNSLQKKFLPSIWMKNSLTRALKTAISKKSGMFASNRKVANNVTHFAPKKSGWPNAVIYAGKL